MSQIPGISIDE